MRAILRRVRALVLCIAAASAPLSVRAVRPGYRVVLNTEIERFGRGGGLSAVKLPGAAGGYAMAFSRTARVVGGVRLGPGQYTLLLRCRAPAGNADGFYVEIDGRRTRRTAPIGRWGTLAYPFDVKEEAVVSLAVIGQEPGMTVDRIAVIRGRHGDNAPRLEELPAAPEGAAGVRIEDLPRLNMACRLASLPNAPFRKSPHTVYLQHFDEPSPGASGVHAQVPGKWGRALDLGMPDGRFSIRAGDLPLGPKGTIEWWVRPRAAQELWWDQGWHFFLHLASRDGKSFQLDLSRHPLTDLRLTASNSEGPYYTNDRPGSREWTQVSTSGVDNTEWHHLLVSWDLGGRRDTLWLLVDGVGTQLFFPHKFVARGFARIDFGNTPPDWDVPFLPMDGAIDELRISNVSVAGRLAE